VLAAGWGVVSLEGAQKIVNQEIVQLLTETRKTAQRWFAKTGNKYITSRERKDALQKLSKLKNLV